MCLPQSAGLLPEDLPRGNATEKRSLTAAADPHRAIRDWQCDFQLSVQKMIGGEGGGGKFRQKREVTIQMNVN